MGKNKNKTFFWVFLFGVLLFIALIASLLILFDEKKTDSRGCLEKNAEHYVELSILVDATEPLKAAQLENVSSYVQGRVSELSPHDRVRVFSIIESNGQSLKPAFDYCKPNPDSLESPIKKRFEKLRFKSFIEKELRENEGVQPSSPIIFSIGSVASQFKTQLGTKEIILISDLIEHSETLSMYHGDWKKIAESQEVNKSRPMLNDVEIQILWLMRPTEDKQTVEIRDWWRDYLRNSRGYVSKITAVTGN